MKQLIFLSLMTTASIAGGLFAPFVAVAWYYALALLRPNHLWDWTAASDIRWSFIAALGAIGVTLINGSRCLRTLRWNPLMTLILVMGSLLLLSTTLSYEPSQARPWMFEYGKLLLMALIACIVIDRLDHLRALSLIVAICIGYVAYGVNRHYFFTPYRMRIFEHGFGGYDNNGAGLILALGVPFAYAAARETHWLARHVAAKALAALLAVFMIHGVMLSFSRGAMVSLVAGLGWLVWRHTPRRQVPPLAAAMGVVILVLAGQEIRDEFLSSADYGNDPTAQLRFQSWAAAWRITMDHPVIGVGVRNSNLFSQNYGADTLGRTIHNQYLQTSADMGLPALFVYLAMLGCGFFGAVKGRRLALGFTRSPAGAAHDDEMQLLVRLCTAVECGLVIFAMGGMFLSLETFEIAWLVMVMGAVAPRLIRERIASLTADEAGAPAAAPPPPAEAPPPLTYAERRRRAA